MGMSQRHNITAILYDKRGKILAIGKNNYLKTHPLQAKSAQAVGEAYKIFLHAEIDALVKAKTWDKAHKLVITRFTKDGKPALAKPCKICQHAIKLAGIKLVEHT
jgi:tRNA(Arg) A34 adenosine deaminase TadA